MSIPNIKSIEDVTDDRIASLAGLAQNLSIQSDDVIQLYANNSIMSPDAQQALESDENILMDEPTQDAAFDTSAFIVEEDERFGILSFPEDDFLGGLWTRIKGLFTNLRKKVRRIFCQVVTALGNAEDLDLKKIIKDVLLVLIPVLGASTGLMPIALPIVVSLSAMLIKYGVSKVCPV